MAKSVEKEKKNRQKNPLKKIVKNVGGDIGETAMSMVPYAGRFLAPVGRRLGKAGASGLNKFVSSLFKGIKGSGEYSIKDNTVLYANNMTPDMNYVKMGTSGHKAVVIAMKEYCFDVISSSSANTFENKVYAITPTNAVLFPWLSQLVQNWQQYRFNGLVFEYRSMSSNALNSTNTQLGRVSMATQYNANARPFTRLVDMENSEYSMSVKPSEAMIHPIECNKDVRAQDMLFINLNPNATNNDLRFNNVGNLSIATSAFQGTSVNCGSIYVHYEIELVLPTSVAIGRSGVDHYQFTDASTTDYFNYQLATLQDGSSLGTVLTANAIEFPETFNGNVLILTNYLGGNGTWSYPTITPSNGAVDNDVVNNDTGHIVIEATESFGCSRSDFFTIKPLGNGTKPTLTFSSGSLPDVSGNCDLFIIATPLYD